MRSLDSVRLQYFGDSYDIVKKSLIAWLLEFGPWVTHPMFTEPFEGEKAAAFSRMLGTPLLSNEVLTTQTDRVKYFSSCLTAGNLFLDPDTGVCLKAWRGAKSVNYVYAEELIGWCSARPNALTLVFDQSYSRGSTKDDMHRKLAYLAQQDIYGFAYASHATFLLLSADCELVESAREKLLDLSGLPASRLVRLASTRRNLSEFSLTKS